MRTRPLTLARRASRHCLRTDVMSAGGGGLGVIRSMAREEATGACFPDARALVLQLTSWCPNGAPASRSHAPELQHSRRLSALDRAPRIIVFICLASAGLGFGV